MPNMDGPANWLMKLSGGAGPGLKVLFTTGFTRCDHSQREDQPQHPFIAKPFTLEDLARKVREALGR